MSESLRDRVARVLYGLVPVWDFTLRRDATWEEVDADDRREHYVQADALIAAGLVTEPEWEYGFRKKDGGMSSPDARWRTPEQAGAWMITTDTLMRRTNPEPGDWQEVPREAL